MRILIAMLIFLMSPIWATAQSPTQAPAQTADEIDALVRILENDQTRALLIERLQQAETGAAAAAAEPTQPDVPSFNIVQQVSSFIANVSSSLEAAQQSVISVFADLRAGVGPNAKDMSALGHILLDVTITFLAVFGTFLVLRILLNWIGGAVSRRLEGKRWPIRVGGAAFVGLVDLIFVLVAGVCGYVAAFALNGIENDVEATMELFIIAFLTIEIYKVGLRILLAPRYPALRFIPMQDESAAYWSFWLNRLISLVGYTELFIGPAIELHLSASIALVVQVLSMATAVVIATIIILQNRVDVKNRLLALAEKRQGSGMGQLIFPLALYWHLLAIGYVLALFLVWLTNPDEALPYMTGATFQSAVAIAVGAVVVWFIGRFVGLGLHLPGDIRTRLPLLESRLYTFVPAVMNIVRWGVVVAVIVSIIQAWAIFDVVGWLGSPGGQQVVGSVLSATLVVVGCIVLHIVVASWVEYRLSTTSGKIPTAREKTLLNLFKNAFTIALVVFGLMMALAQIGVNIAPLLAGAGVVGLAIGFGAQKLVQDIITGIFIQFENVMNEGDAVAVGDKSGTVEKLTIRSVTIRDMTGTVHLIPFSSVDQVSNMMRGFSFYVAEFEVARDSDIEVVKQSMRDAFATVMETEHSAVILDALDPPSLITITPTSMTFRARIKTLAGKQWTPGRLYTETVLQLFNLRGIRTPTQRISYFAGGQDRLPPMGEEPAGD